MKKETKSKFADLVIQILSVMVGVYLGFLVSNFGDERQLISQLSTFENNIRTEIKMNRSKIEGMIDYHRMLRDSSNFYLNSDKDITQRPGFFKGMRLPTLISSAYNTGIQTGIINELSIDEIQRLNQIYNTQQTFNEYISIVMPGILSIDLNGENMDKLLRYISLTMTDFVIKEEALLEMYNQND